MSTLAQLKLPAVNTTMQARHALEQRLAWLGEAAVWQRRPAGNYLCFVLRDNAGTAVRGWVEVNSWAQVHLPGVKGLAWSQCPPQVIADLVTPAPVPVELAQTRWDYEQADFEGLQIFTQASTAMPRWPGREGGLWIVDLDAPALEQVSGEPGTLPGQLKLPVELQLAQVPMSVGRLERLRRHDIVLLGPLTPRARRGQRDLFRFSFDLEYITVNELFGSAEDPFAPAPALPSPTSQAAHVSNLPITVEIVLCDLEKTVAELGQLQPGVVWTLPPQAHQRVQLQVNGQRLAEGELVQVGEALGVQITRPPIRS